MPDTRQSPPAPLQLRLGARPAATPAVHLGFQGIPASERLLRLREFFEPLGMGYDAAHDGNPVEIELTLRGMPGIQMLSGRMQGARYRRIRLNNDPTEDVGLVLNPGGAHFISQLGREIELGDGDATLISLTEPLTAAHHPPAGLRVLRLPRMQLAPLLARGQDGFLRRIPRDLAALGLLRGYVNVAWREPTVTDPELGRLVVSHLYDLVAVTLGASRDVAHAARGGGLRAARLAAIKRDIARNLDRPGLSVSGVAARHGCTEREVQRMFEMESTTFTNHVLAQRLARAHRMLTDPDSGAKISAVAYDCGFGDLSYFNRVFRRLYGVAPSDIRARARRSAGDNLGLDGS